MNSGGWNTVALREVLERVKRPIAVEPDVIYRSLGVRWYSDGCFVKTEKPGSEIAAKTLFRVDEGDVLYSRLFAWKGSLAVAGPEHAGAVVSNEFPTYLADPERLLPEYFAIWASRPEVWAEAESISSGTAANSRFRLAEDAFEAFEIELPPVNQQHDIVAAVRRADAALTSALSERDAAFLALSVATNTLLAAEEAWELLPDGWELKTLAEVADIRSGITKGRKTADALHPRPFIRAANVQNGYVKLDEVKTIEVTDKELERFALLEGDVLMIEGGNAEHLGRGWVWENQVENCLHQNHVFRARPDRGQVLPRYLAYAIAASPARAHCIDSAKRTTNLASINKTQISQMPVVVPPLVAQAEIVEQLDVIRRCGVLAGRMAERLTVLRAALGEDLVSGAVRAPALTPMAELPEAA